ncbi:MAG TPA: hypothetical protein VGP47_04050 [Parachlamydiaceae bacterium]|nr:hypothetical protein [Parachlamydiaceae bacterium]
MQFKNSKNPIYYSTLIKEHPEKSVLIVEGEKAADSGNKMFDHLVSVSWFGGAGGAKKVVWSLLYGKEVIIWPDNDEAGFKAADDISACLKRVGVKSLHVVDKNVLNKEFPEKWDIADPLPSGKDFSFIKDCIQRAEPKAVSINQLSTVLNVVGKDGKDQIEVMKLNEILWRVDERVRPTMEKEFKSKPWKLIKAFFLKC